MNYINVTYLLSSNKKFNVQEKAKRLAEELTIGSKDNLNFNPKLKAYEGKVVEYLDFYEKDKKIYKALITIGFPLILFKHDIPSLFTVIFGKLSMEKNIKLINIDFPPTYLDYFQGPRYGIAGIRELIGIKHEPLLMGVIKGAFGLSSEQYSQVFFQMASAGFDIIKDDEIFFDEATAPFEDRIEHCLKKADEAERTTGRKTLYVPNLIGHIDELYKKIEKGLEAGIKLFLINVVPYGFDVLQTLSQNLNAGFIAHPSFSGAIYQSDYTGIDSTLLIGKLMRLAGADAVIFPSPYKNFPHTKSMEISTALKEDFENIKPSFPIPTGGISIEKIPQVYKDFGTQVIINTGGYPYTHPDGIFAGSKAYRDLLDCTMNGVSTEECRLASEELDKFLKVYKK